MKLAYHSLRPTSQGEEIFQSFFDWFVAGIHEDGADHNLLVCETLYRLTTGKIDYIKAMAEAKSSGNLAEMLHLENMNPANAALEPEYYGDVDKVRYARNTLFAFPFRRILGGFMFKSLGDNVKLFHNIEITYGYNLSIGDDVVVHREVLLDDRGGITIGSNASISDFANIYSHTHDSDDINDITMHHTVIGPNARVTYHSTVLSGSSLGEFSILGAMGLATRPISDFEIKGGVPARQLGTVHPSKNR